MGFSQHVARGQLGFRQGRLTTVLPPYASRPENFRAEIRIANAMCFLSSL